MAIDNKSIISGQPPHLEWRVYKNDTTALTVAMVTDDLETAVDLTGWTWASKVRQFPDSSTVQQTLSVSVNENFLTIPLNTTNLPPVSYFDVQGTYTSTNTIRTILSGTIYAETDVTR
jgi:hypothetical protein